MKGSRVNHTSEFVLRPVSAPHWLTATWGQGGSHKPQALWAFSLMGPRTILWRKSQVLEARPPEAQGGG